jgi:hypothetical protein
VDLAASEASPAPPTSPLHPDPQGPSALLADVWGAGGPPDKEPADARAPAPSAPAAGWPCAVCGASNDLSLDACAACGASFAKLFDEPGVARSNPRSAALSSLVFPGLGHARAGKGVEGIGRGLAFVFTLGAGLFMLLGGGGGAPGAMAVGFLTVAAALYVVTAVDAYRAASGITQLVPARYLLYGSSALLVVAALSTFLMAGRPGPR